MTAIRKNRYIIARTVSLVAVLVVLIAFSGWASRAAASDAEVAVQIQEAERAASRGAYPTDGTFTGAAQGFGGIVEVSVTIDNGYIDAVEIVDASSEDDAWLEMAIVLPDRIVEAQTTAIDVVSGATFTSAGILNATTEALNKSLAGDAV